MQRALILPALALIVYRTEGLRFFSSKRLIYAALISIGALVAIYAYLPLEAAHAPVINWVTHARCEKSGGIYPQALSGVLRLTPKIIGEQSLKYQAALAPSPVRLVTITAAVRFGRLRETSPERDRATFWFLLVVVIADSAYRVQLQIAEDKDAYSLPAFLGIAVAAGFGIRWLIQLTVSKPILVRRAYLIAAIAVLLPVTTEVASNWPFNDRRHYFIAQDYSKISARSGLTASY